MVLNKILKKETLNSVTKLMIVEAPNVARKAQPGQFVVLRTGANGERIPLTIADFDREVGTVTIIFQEVGKTTMELGSLNEGEYIHDFTGPLGVPSELDGYKRVCVIGGGLGCAIAYPQAKRLKELGACVDVIAGFRTNDLIILENELRETADSVVVCTDDGSNGRKALVTNELKALLDAGKKYDVVIAIGPVIMMKFVAQVTREYNQKTIVSMNTIMVDGTGMCGCCRLTVGDETKFACVDGPDFDGHLVDYDEVMRRSAMYKDFEREAVENHQCRLVKGADESHA